MPKPLIIFMLMFLMTSIIFFFLTTRTHLMMMIILLIIYSIMATLIIYIKSDKPIYSIMIFMIMISGLLIIFLYFVNLISNESNNINIHKNLTFFNLVYLFLWSIYLSTNMNFINPIYNNKEMELILKINSSTQSIFNLYIYPYNNLTLLCILFLLISLLLIIKMCMIKLTPLRKLT